MGRLVYDQVASVEFDDRLLLHFQIVIGIKLRRRESFYFSWRDEQTVGKGRQTIWLHPAVLLLFKYYGSRTPQVNPAWVHALELAANTSSGLQCVPEPDVREVWLLSGSVVTSLTRSRVSQGNVVDPSP